MLLEEFTLGVLVILDVFTLTVFRDFGWICTVCFYCFCRDLAVSLLFGLVAVKNTFVACKTKFLQQKNIFIAGKIKCCLRKNILESFVKKFYK